MKANNLEMFHYHKKNKYDDIWVPNNEIIVNNNFDSFYGELIKNFSTAVLCLRSNKTSFDNIISYYIEHKEKLDKEMALRILKESKKIISNTNIYKREDILENYRRENCSEKPSRLHSIWVINKKQLNYWMDKLSSNNEKLELYRVSLTGNLFKSSDSLIPNNDITIEEMKEIAGDYWHPNFNDVDDKTCEYLFQGKVKILSKCNF